MLLSIHIVSTSMSALDDVKKAFQKNLPFLIGDHSLHSVLVRYEFISDQDGDELFECEEPIITH